MNMPRRQFLKRGALAAAVIPLTSRPRAQVTSTRAETPGGLPMGWREWRKFDAHNHVFGLAHRPNNNGAEV